MCDYVFLAHNVAREPGDPLAAKDARNCACAVVRLVETIRAYLPVEGRKRQKSWRVQERAGCTVCNLYLATEKVRNPNKYPFGAGRGTSDSFDYWPDGLHTPWVDLCDSLDTLAEFFGWQAVSLGEKLPGIPNVRAGGTIPPVPTDLLGDLQSAAETIMALTVDQPEGVKSETKIEGADPRDHEAEPAKPTGGNKRKPAATINERMAGTIMENPDAMELSSMGEAPEMREIIGGRNDNMEETRKRTATGEGRTDERPTKEIEGER